MTRTSPRKALEKSGPCLENIRKLYPKYYPKEWFYICILRLGATCGSFGAPIEFLMHRMLPKSSQNDDEILKVTPKDIPWTDNCVKDNAES